MLFIHDILNQPVKTKVFVGKVLITALPQIETKGMTLDDMETLMEKVKEVMTTTYHETSKEVIESLNPNSSQRVT